MPNVTVDLVLLGEFTREVYAHVIKKETIDVLVAYGAPALLRRWDTEYGGVCYPHRTLFLVHLAHSTLIGRGGHFCVGSQRLGHVAITPDGLPGFI